STSLRNLYLTSVFFAAAAPSRSAESALFKIFVISLSYSLIFPSWPSGPVIVPSSATLHLPRGSVSLISSTGSSIASDTSGDLPRPRQDPSRRALDHPSNLSFSCAFSWRGKKQYQKRRPATPRLHRAGSILLF